MNEPFFMNLTLVIVDIATRFQFKPVWVKIILGEFSFVCRFPVDFNSFSFLIAVNVHGLWRLITGFLTMEVHFLLHVDLLPIKAFSIERSYNSADDINV